MPGAGDAARVRLEAFCRSQHPCGGASPKWFVEWRDASTEGSGFQAQVEVGHFKLWGPSKGLIGNAAFK